MYPPQRNEKVELTYTSKLTKSLAITKTSTTQCYEWSIKDIRPRKKDGTERIRYICAGCRQLRDANEVPKD